MRPPLAAALETVAVRLREHRIPFLLGGSALLDALGLDVEVRDIDLMLRPGDRARFEAACGDWLLAVTTELGELMRSEWVATLDVDGVEVEGLGGLGMEIEGETVQLPFRGHDERAEPEVWWFVYRTYKPERATLLEQIVSEEARARILAELGSD
jgi:hypothetical protein